MKTPKTKRNRMAPSRSVQRLVRRMVVSNILVCHLPHQSGPFVIGTVRDPKSETGHSNVWLRNDGQWTKEETSPKCNLRVGHWNPPSALMSDGAEKL